MQLGEEDVQRRCQSMPCFVYDLTPKDSHEYERKVTKRDCDTRNLNRLSIANVPINGITYNRLQQGRPCVQPGVDVYGTFHRPF